MGAEKDVNSDSGAFYNKEIVIELKLNEETKEVKEIAGKIISKDYLFQLVKEAFSIRDDEEFEVLRFSKKSGNYVALKEKKDFNSLKRSLEVKKRLKLVIKKKEQPLQEAVTGLNLDSIKQKVDEIHAKLVEDKTIHYDVYCDICKSDSAKSHSKTPPSYIMGTRYKCTECFDFDLCENCFENSRTYKNHKLDHQMYVIRSETNLIVPTQQSRKDTDDEILEISQVNVGRDEINEYKKELDLILKEFNSVEKLKQLREGYYKSLGGTQAATGTGTGTAGSGKLQLSFTGSNDCLTFKLRNDSTLTAPKDMTLVFRGVSSTQAAASEIALGVGPHEILPNGEKKLITTNGEISKLLINNSYELLLVGQDGEVFAAGAGGAVGAGSAVAGSADLFIEKQWGAASGAVPAAAGDNRDKEDTSSLSGFEGDYDDYEVLSTTEFEDE